jgi:hypothetical protein
MLLVFAVAGYGERRGQPEAAAASRKETSTVATVNPKDVLFTTPTLNDALPKASDDPAPADSCYEMHEDNWRQFEFVSPSFADEIAAEVAAIDKIWKEESVPLQGMGTAFRRVHVRKRIPKPLAIPLSPADFEKLLGSLASPMTLTGYDKTLRDVRAARLTNVIIYGAFHGGKVTTIGIEALDRFAIGGEPANRLEQFVVEHDFRLVHWPSRTVFKTPQAAMKYLRGNGTS